MTWLPISLKNAAKCDKWYQLQNLSITESLNAKGAWEKTLVVHPHACHVLSVEQKPTKKQILCLAKSKSHFRFAGAVALSVPACGRDNGANLNETISQHDVHSFVRLWESFNTSLVSPFVHSEGGAGGALKKTIFLLAVKT